MVQQGGMSTTAAEDELKGTVAADKNEILFSRFAINYNNEPEMFRKGSVVFREFELEEPSDSVAMGGRGDDAETSAVSALTSKIQAEKIRKAKAKARVVVQHVDIIKEDFWERRPWILDGRPGRPAWNAAS
jgi:tRNA(His) guanylyltransferase